METKNYIHHCRNRTTPLVRNKLKCEAVTANEYASLIRGRIEHLTPDIKQEKCPTLDRMKQKSLNLDPPSKDMFQNLSYVPTHFLKKIQQNHFSKYCTINEEFHSILLPSNRKNVRLDKSSFKVILKHFLERGFGSELLILI